LLINEPQLIAIQRISAQSNPERVEDGVSARVALADLAKVPGFYRMIVEHFASGFTAALIVGSDGMAGIR
jgi:hypothetical protein